MFSKKNNFIQTTDNVVKHQGKNSDYWVIARDSLFFTSIALAGVSTKDYRSFIEQSIEHLNPFENHASYIIVKNEFAMVWIWDNARQQKFAESHSQTNIKVIPETVIKSPVLGDGVHIIKLFNGFETQYWLEGVLRASRWWHEMPIEAEWQRFCRSVSVKPVTIPSSITQKVLGRPWSKNFITKDDIFMKKVLARLWLASILIGLVLFAKLFSTYFVEYEKSLQLDKKMSQLELKSADILDKKNNVIEGLAKLKRYSQVKVSYRQIDLMNLIGRQFPKKDKVKIVLWFFDQDHLEIEIIGKKLDPSFYVRIFQKLPQFKSVFSEPGKKHGSLRLRFDLNMSMVQK